MDYNIFIIFAIGLATLIIGAEFLVRGASRLALSLGISSLIIGLIIVAFGTSSPELFVGIQARLTNNAGILLGNVVGSNIFNTLFIIGIAALINPIVVSLDLIRLDVPIMIIISIILLLMCLDGDICYIDGFILSLGIIYTIFSLSHSKQSDPDFKEKISAKNSNSSNSRFFNILFIILGFALLIISSNLLIKSSVSIAKHLGISQLVLGVT